MSYEGREEFLCSRGHYTVSGIYNLPEKCICGNPFTHTHSIDDTNGYDPEDSRTYPAKKAEIGFDDIWRTDHYGNQYASKHIRYRPLKDWKTIPKLGEQ